MRSLVVLSLSLAPLLLGTGCPKPLADDERWIPVESEANAGEASDAETAEQRERVRRVAMEARVKKMRAALISADEATCTADADCDLTSFHCCSCSAGGQMAAVNKAKLPDLLKRRGIVCQECACAQVVSDHPSCAAERAVCREGRCVPDVPAGSPPLQEGVGVEPIPDSP